jgi:TnpA family transposase
MDMNRVFVDTHGQSVIGFAVSYLLKFALCPRLKAINKQKLYYVDSGDKKKYPNIEDILKTSINWQIIEDNYDEAVEHMVALKLGIVAPEVLIKKFSINNYNNPLYQALVEIGKANKTIFLCEYLSSEDLRIEINEGLNVVERLNNVMDFIFYDE